MKKTMLLALVVFCCAQVYAADLKRFHVYTGVKAVVLGSMVLGRETTVSYVLPDITAEGKNISYDDIFYGYMTDNRISAVKKIIDSDITFFAGGGVSMASSAVKSNQLALLINLKSTWGIFYLNAEHLIYKDGLLGDYSLGLDWVIFQGGAEFGICFDLGALLSTDYTGAGFYPCADLGIKAGF